jgi:hypothetical protein
MSADFNRVENSDCDGQNTCAECGSIDYHALGCSHSIAAGRTWLALKEGKVFDAERLAESPLFDRKLF